MREYITPTNVARGVVYGLWFYLQIVVFFAAVGGAIIGNGYANSGRGIPDISSMAPPTGGYPGYGLVYGLFDTVAQSVATVTYIYLGWIPFSVFGILTCACIAYFGIYRVGERGWNILATRESES